MNELTIFMHEIHFFMNVCLTLSTRLFLSRNCQYDIF